MPGRHLGLQQKVPRCCHITQLSDPLSGFHIQHPRIVQRCGGQNIRVRLRLHVLVRGIGRHVVIYCNIFQRVAPLLPLDHSQRKLRHQNRGQRIHKRHCGVNGLKTAPAHVGHGTHEQTTGRTALRHQQFRRGHAATDQVIRHVNEVGEGVLLSQHFAIVVPQPAHFTTATHVRHGHDNPAVEQTQPQNAHTRIDGAFVGAVTVQQGGVRHTHVQVSTVNHRHRHLRAIPRSHPQTVRHIVVTVVAAGNLLLLQQPKLTCGGPVVVQSGGRRKGIVAETETRSVPIVAGAETDVVQLLIKLQFLELGEPLLT